MLRSNAQTAQNQVRFTFSVHSRAAEIEILTRNKFSIYDLLKLDVQELGDLGKAILTAKNLKTRQLKLGNVVPAAPKIAAPPPPALPEPEVAPAPPAPLALPEPEVVPAAPAPALPEPEVAPAPPAPALPEPEPFLLTISGPSMVWTSTDTDSLKKWVRKINGRMKKTIYMEAMFKIKDLWGRYGNGGHGTPYDARQPGQDRVTFWVTNIELDQPTKKQMKQMEMD